MAVGSAQFAVNFFVFEASLLLLSHSLPPIAARLPTAPAAAASQKLLTSHRASHCSVLLLPDHPVLAPYHPQQLHLPQPLLPPPPCCCSLPTVPVIPNSLDVLFLPVCHPQQLDPPAAPAAATSQLLPASRCTSLPELSRVVLLPVCRSAFPQCLLPPLPRSCLLPTAPVIIPLSVQLCPGHPVLALCHP